MQQLVEKSKYIIERLDKMVARTDEDLKERIQRKVSDIEDCGAKTTLQEIGDDILNKVEQQLEKILKNIKTDYLAANINYLMQSVAPVLGWSDTEEEEAKTWLYIFTKD